MPRTQPTPTPLDRLRRRRARAAQIRRRRSMACSSVAPRKRSAPGGLPPPPPGPRRSALASRRARRHASAAPQVRARRPQSSRPATAGLPAAHHRRRSTVSALRSASPVRPALRRAPGARLVHAPVSPPGARHVTRPAIAGRRTAPLQFRQRHRLRGRAARCGRTASASLQPCPATAPARPLCALPRGARAAPPWLRVLRSLSVSVLGVSCLRPASAQWAGTWSGWAWREAVRAASPENRGRCPHLPLSRGARGLGVKGHPQPSGPAYFFGAASRVRACGARLRRPLTLEVPVVDPSYGSGGIGFENDRIYGI